MLKDDLYKLISLSNEAEFISAGVELLPDCRIFEGHFPGQPVVPGVCLIQIIKEITEIALSRTLLLKNSSIIKFLNPVLPSLNSLLSIRISIKKNDDKTIKTDAQIFFEDITFVKFKGNFAEVSK